ncbi:MAG: nucleotidyltransferase domain-containing protein [Pirellulales bacterium]|nr:nucleotidyltransferase domain-containing protein [Pirellulales bacterium]
MIRDIQERQSEVQSLCKRFDVARLELFGSAASEGAFNPQESDLDFLVEFNSPLDLGPWLSRYFQFREALFNLFGRPVDLVMTSAIKSQRFLEEAGRTRRLIYGP